MSGTSKSQSIGADVGKHISSCFRETSLNVLLQAMGFAS